VQRIKDLEQNEKKKLDKIAKRRKEIEEEKREALKKEKEKI